MSDKVDITLTINGRDYAIRVEPRKTLVDAIREDCGQTGTHIGCEHGVCGTCTVILDNDAVRSCLMFAVQAQGKNIRTVEGLGTPDKPHPIQAAYVEEQVLQCGYCINGWIMTAAALLNEKKKPTDAEIKNALTGLKCRCGTHMAILRAVHRAAEMMG